MSKLHVGICGAGMGGLTAAIAIARTGAKVTLLEAAKELGEIGAGIQVFPNVSRLLVRWGVDELIGGNLIAVDEINTWDTNNDLIARFDPKLGAKLSGFPHWLVRRDHLHAGLVECARRHGVNMVVGSRVESFEYTEQNVTVTAIHGLKHTFDLLVGSDGLKSTIRKSLHPGLTPQAASTVAAFRGILPYEKVFAEVPEARQFLRNSMDAWVGPNGYILLYPLTAGTELNVVTVFQMDRIVKTAENMNVQDFRDLYKDWSPVIKKIIGLVEHTQIWPLLVLPPLKSWSNDHKNVVLLGDAAHCMQNHMAQGAATAMEDGAFLGTVISEVTRGTITLTEAIQLYEKKRIPRAWVKQQASFVSGTLNMATGDDAMRRNMASAREVKAWDQNILHPSEGLPATYRSWQMYCTPTTVPGILYYDPEGDADNAVCEYLQSKTEMDTSTFVTKGLWDKWWAIISKNSF